jgi:hypothetical protein
MPPPKDEPANDGDSSNDDDCEYPAFYRRIEL